MPSGGTSICLMVMISSATTAASQSYRVPARPATRADIRPVMPGRPAEGPEMPPRVSRCLSAAGVRFLGILFPPGSSALLTVGLPGSAWTLAGFPRSAHPSHGRIGRPLCPEASGAHTTGPVPPAAARPLSQGPGPITPARIPSPGAVYYEASSRVHSRSPARPSPWPVGPWMEQGPPWARSPGFAPQQAGPAAHAGAGDGHRALARSYTPGITGPPSRTLTRNVRPRVARPAWT